MKNLYSKTLERLQQQVPELAWIDLELGQMDNLSGEKPPPVNFPCALIEIAYPQTEDVNRCDQLCTVRMEIRVAFDGWTDQTDSTTPTDRLEQSLAKLDTVGRVYRAIQGWADDNFNPWSRTAQTPEKRYDGYKVFRIEFSTTLQEDE